MEEPLLQASGEQEYGSTASFFGEESEGDGGTGKAKSGEPYVLVDLEAREWGRGVARDKQVLGYAASMAIFLNAIVGPGFLSLPRLYKDSGIIVPTGLLVAGFAIAVFSTVVRSETVALMPGNAHYSRVVEFCDPPLKFVGRATFYWCHVLFYVAAMATAIASIVLVTQTLDILIAHVFGQSYALALNGANRFDVVAWNLHQNCKSDAVCKPFLTGHQMRATCFISLGYLVAFAVLYPVSTNRLSEGMALQYASVAAMCVAVPVLMGKDVLRIVTDGTKTLAVFEGGYHALDASGVVLFNLMYGIFVSTWLTEKRPDVGVKRVVAQSSAFSCVLMIAYGVLGALSARAVAVNGLSAYTEKGVAPAVLAAAVLFGFFVIASGIPVACVMARHNLVSSPVIIVTDSVASALTVVLPWASAWLFVLPKVYSALLNYTGLFVVSWLALWMPFFVLLARHDPLPDPPSSLGYLAWFLKQLTDPPDFDIDTVIFPLPAALLPYSRRIYALMLLLISVWIVACLASYIFWFIFFIIDNPIF